MRFIVSCLHKLICNKIRSELRERVVSIVALHAGRTDLNLSPNSDFPDRFFSVALVPLGKSRM
jgi:hypothetical protein